MLLLIYFITLFLVLRLYKISSPSLLLISIYVLSLTCGLVIGQNYEINSLFKAFNFLFLVVILTILILPWNKFNYKIPISEPNPRVLRIYTIILFCVNGIIFFVIMAIFYQVHPEVTDIENFKNSGVAKDVIMNLNIPYPLLLFSWYFYPTAYFLIPIHFYYLIKNKFFLSSLSFLFSLNIALLALTVFSRSGIVEYLFLYGFYFFFFYHGIKGKIKDLFKNKIFISFVIAVTVGFGCLTVYFYEITENRFKNLPIKSDTFIENPAIFYLFDYASMWFKNSNEVMSLYQFNILKGELSFPLLYVIANKLQLIHYPAGTLEDKLYSIWGDNSITFNGLIANLIFDFGYLGSTLFALTYFFIIRSIKLKKDQMSFNTLLVLGVFFILPAMGIFNSHMKLVAYNALIVYTIIVCLCVFLFKNILK